jgi:uncharacterized membrane protein YhiD involved in acid resistance
MREPLLPVMRPGLLLIFVNRDLGSTGFGFFSTWGFFFSIGSACTIRSNKFKSRRGRRGVLSKNKNRNKSREQKQEQRLEQEQQRKKEKMKLTISISFFEERERFQAVLFCHTKSRKDEHRFAKVVDLVLDAVSLPAFSFFV